MNWQDKGYLLSLNKYNENSSIAEFFTENNGKIIGIIFGSTSKKIKSYLLIGNKFHINSKLKEDGRLGYLKIEIDEIKTPIYMENKKKFFCIIYCMNLIKILTVENEINKELYTILEKLFKIINLDNWLVEFLFLELKNWYTPGSVGACLSLLIRCSFILLKLLTVSYYIVGY